MAAQIDTGEGLGREGEALRAWRLDGAVDLLVYPTRRFKTSLVNILVHRPLDRDTAAGALLPFVLRRGTRRLPDMAAIARRLDDLFGASLDADVARAGERQVLTLRAEVVDDRYLLMGGRGLLRQCFGLLRDVLLDPVLDGRLFPESTFAQERLNLRRFVEGLANDKARYAADRCVKIMCAGEPYGRLEYGEPEEIEAVTRERLVEVWEETLATAPVEVYVVGSVDPEEVRDAAEECFGAIRDGSRVAALAPAVRRRPGRLRRVREASEVVQARMVLGYRTGGNGSGEVSWPLAVWNTILGSGPYCRLFQEVRERHSLAYYCHSTVDHAKGVAFVQAGIDVEAAPRVESIVRREMAALRCGRFSADEIREARDHLRAEIVGSADSPARIAAFFMEQKAFGGARSLAEAAARVARVRAADVAAAAAEVEPDIAYLLARGQP